MNLRVLYVVALISLGLGPQVVEAKKAQTNIAVINLEAKTGVDPSIAELMSDILRTELYNSGRFAVMNREDMDIILKEIAFQQSGACDETSCIVQMGQALGVRKMVAGTIGILGGKYVINAKLINVESFTNEVLVTEFTPVDSKDGPQLTFRSVAWQLAGLRKLKFKSLDEDRIFGIYATIGMGSMNIEKLASQTVSGTFNSTNYSVTADISSANAYPEYWGLGIKVFPAKWLLLDASWYIAGFNAEIQINQSSTASGCTNCETPFFMKVDSSSLNFSASWVRDISEKLRVIAGGGVGVTWNAEGNENNNTQGPNEIMFGSGANSFAVIIQQEPLFSGEDHMSQLRPFIRGGAEVRPSPQIGFSVLGNLYLTEHEELIGARVDISTGDGSPEEMILDLVEIKYPRFTVDAALAFYF